MTDWEQIAQDPNSVKWDEEQVASLQKFVENTKRLQEENERLKSLFPRQMEGGTMSEFNPKDHNQGVWMIYVEDYEGVWPIAACPSEAEAITLSAEANARVSFLPFVKGFKWGTNVQLTAEIFHDGSVNRSEYRTPFLDEPRHQLMPDGFSPWPKDTNFAFVVQSRQNEAGEWSPPSVALRTSGSDPELAERQLVEAIESVQQANLPMIPNKEGKLTEALKAWAEQHEGWRGPQ